MSDNLAEILLWPLVDVSLRWGLLIVGLAAWFAIRPPRRAATRHMLCVVAMLAGPALALAPRWDAYVRGLPPVPAPIPAPDFSATRPVVPAEVRATDAPIAATAPPSSAHAPTAAPATATPLDWGKLAAKALVAAWLAGTLAMLARLGLGIRALRRWAREATPATADDRALLDACRASLPTSRPVRLMRHPGAASPVVVGGIRPAIMLPADWDAWPVDRRRAAMHHELAHVRWYDDASKLLEELLRAPTWFHPAVAWLLARLDRERELLRDEAAVATGDDPKGLARLLLDLSRHPSPRRLPSASLPFLDRRATAIRIQRLLEEDMPRTLSRPSLARSLILGSTALALAVGLGALRVRTATAQDAPTPKPAEAAPAPSPEAPAPIEGVVVDPDGKAIAGATVVVDGKDFGRRVLTTDAEGKFSAPGAAGVRWIRVGAATPGWVPGWHQSEVGAPADAAVQGPLVLKLSRPAPISATLVDEEDRPLAGATARVDWMAYIEPTPGEDGRTTTHFRAPRDIEGSPIDRHFTATTAEDGAFRLPDAVPAGVAVKLQVTTRDGRPRITSRPAGGPHALTLEAEGYLVPRPGEPIRVRTEAPARVMGKVVSNVPGVDLSGLRAWYQASRGAAGASPPGANSWGEAPVDADGRFMLDGLEAGSVNVFVGGEGEAASWTYRAVENLPLELGRDADATIELIEGVEVSGLVTTEDDRPIPGAKVAVYGPLRPRSGAATISRPTDADGRYRFRLPAGETYFYIFSLPEGDARGAERGHRTVTIPDGVARFEVPPLLAPAGPPREPAAVKRSTVGRAVDEPDAPAPPDVKGPADVAPDELAGVVVDEAGNPIAGAEVDAWTWYKGNETTTDARGFFRLGGLGEGRKIQVRISKEGRTPSLSLQQPTGQPGWVVVLTDKTYFEGRVTAPDGKPVAGALVRANCGPKQGEGVRITEIWSEARSDADGRYRLHTQPDVYDLQVREPGVGVFRRLNVVLPSGHAQALDLPLERGVAFRARVVDATTGEPVPGARLWHWQHPGVEGRSDEAGDVEIPDMLPGPFQFMVDAPGHARWWSERASTEWGRPEPSRPGAFRRNFDPLDFELSPGMAPVTIMVERAATVIGRVLDPDGKPVAGATAAPALTGTGNSLTGDTRFSVETAADGSFTMMLPASGDREYNLVAHDGKYQEWRTWANGVLPPIRTKPGEVLRDVEIRLTRPATVKGRVTTADGEPAAGVSVRASATDRMENRYYDPTAQTAEDGTYELRFVRPGGQFIQVGPFWLDARQAPAKNSQTVTLADGEVKEGLDFVAPGGGGR
ncbi:carboxypeptidase regulatory-like domain-containing protein [Paludisphaera sp.]|uniref:carboxypeptidase regulatory-like domain-containing protein n=1 Tax=Paludisphaera sp. TaxID=2017432 RepID=UPI00301BDEC4